ncbi:hypothetical protein ACH4KN_34100 [Streptomyces sp. NPDC017546]|uniref:hypothetical protein n=1 Tax=unclassified Streptomyces TaxID=2593676 RepID=UPI002360419E|nr:hypothetical protein [Streptomyces sp. MMBL 11-1]
MSTCQDWSLVPPPGRIVAGLAFTMALHAVAGLTPRHAPEPERVAYDDGGGSTFVLDLGGASPVLVVDDHDERDAPMSRKDVTSALGLADLPGHLAQEDRTFSGAARWDGRSWTPDLGVPGQVVANLVDRPHLLGEAGIVLADVAEGEADRAALAVLLDAVSAGAWTLSAVEAALRLTPNEEDEELEAEPDVGAAAETLELYRPVLRRASQEG